MDLYFIVVCLLVAAKYTGLIVAGVVWFIVCWILCIVGLLNMLDPFVSKKMRALGITFFVAFIFYVGFSIKLLDYHLGTF